MTEVDRIRDQFRRAFEGEAWHGPSVLALLDGVTAQQAAAHPIPGAHSIWELTLHIAAWERACLRRLTAIQPNSATRKIGNRSTTRVTQRGKRRNSS